MPIQNLETLGKIRGPEYNRIFFDGLALQNDTYRTRDIRFKHLPEKVINTIINPRRGGFKVTDSYYTQKVIEVNGLVISDSASNLRTAIDRMKKALHGQEKDLDIDYGDETLRYKATVRSLSIPEEHYHITEVPFRIEFLAEPWAKAIVQKSETFSGITSSPYSSYIDIKGSFPPFPVIEIKVNSATNMSQIKFKNDKSGDEIAVARTFSSGEVLTIDIENETVKVDDTDVDFTGVFPEFEIRHSDVAECMTRNYFTLTITDTGSFSVNLTIKYHPCYL